MAEASRLRPRLTAFYPAPEGGLYAWEQARRYPEVILVEGLFDYAVLWQAGFHNVTCSMGTHLNGHQYRQLCDSPRTVYLVFDADNNGSGQKAAQSLAGRLTEQGLRVRSVLCRLPDYAASAGCYPSPPAFHCLDWTKPQGGRVGPRERVD